MTRSVYIIGISLAASLLLSLARWVHDPRPADQDRAAAWIRARFVAGDQIVAEPPDAVLVRERLGDLSLFQPRQLAADDLAGARRVYTFIADEWWRLPRIEDPLAVYGARTESAEFGRVQVAAYEPRAPERIAFDLRASLHDVRVRVKYPEGLDATCERWVTDRWICPQHSGWNYVGKETLDIDGEPRECVWLHPVNRGGSLTVEASAIGSGRSRRVVCAFGFTFDAAKRAHVPVRVVISANGASIAERSFAPRRGWERWSFPLPDAASSLAVTLTSEDNGAAHFCGSLKVVEPLP